MTIPLSLIQPTYVQQITLVISHPESFQATSRIDKGKGIAIELDEDPSKRLVSASTIIRSDPDEPVRVEFLINEKIVYLTEQEIQEPEVIKVVQEEAKKSRLDPRKIVCAKANGVSNAQRLQRKYAKCLLLLVHNCSVEVNAASENMLKVTTASEYQVNAAS
ncbi:hypothetical protein Tco_0873786 [Tanacetum coccineum]|uniref:Uncharacterized protein n=1 Tax=Tanacetum coccineum TaxID=301880 RepID=A0ABQ5BJV8_9ASTR